MEICIPIIYFNIIGLSFNMAGIISVLLANRPLRKVINILSEDEVDNNVTKKERIRYSQLSYVGIILFLIGFALQLLSSILH